MARSGFCRTFIHSRPASSQACIAPSRLRVAAASASQASAAASKSPILRRTRRMPWSATRSAGSSARAAWYEPSARGIVCIAVSAELAQAQVQLEPRPAGPG